MSVNYEKHAYQMETKIIDARCPDFTFEINIWKIKVSLDFEFLTTEVIFYGYI